jgi:hypothetical protein
MGDGLRGITIDTGESATYESWLVVEPDGSIVHHGENDGARFLRRGPEAHDEPMTLDRVAERFGDLHARCVREVLADFAAGRQPRGIWPAVLWGGPVRDEEVIVRCDAGCRYADMRYEDEETGVLYVTDGSTCDGKLIFRPSSTQ